MSRFLPKIFLDFSSFWAGVLIAIIFLFLFFRYRNRLTTLLRRGRRNILTFRDTLSISSETDYYKVIYKYVQGLHVSADLFPLDSILIPPRCVAPPPPISPGSDIKDPSLVQQTLGYDLALPDLAIEYNAPTFALLDAIANETNICLVGFPGCGKTVAIADCISSMLRGNREASEFTDKIPFYVKAHHVLAQFPGRDMLGILLASILSNPVFNVIPNFPKYLTSTVNSGKAVIFIDDLDLLTYSDTNRIANFIIALRKGIPTLQLITTASPSCLGNLVKTSLEMISVAPWGKKEKYTFLKKWSSAWPSPPENMSSQISDSVSILNSMLVISDPFLSPLEFTLKAWAAYAEDLAGPTSVNSVNSYFQRYFSLLSRDSIHTLENIALHALEQEKSIFTRRDVNTWFSEITGTSSPELADDKISPLAPVLQAALDSNIILKSASDSYYFTNPTIGGYLAARSLGRSSRQIINRILVQPDWSLLHETMRFFSAFVNIQPFISLMHPDRTLLKNNLLRASSWLVNVPKDSPEEVYLLKAITREIHSNSLYLVKLRLIVSLVKSGNHNVKSILQYLLKSDDLDTRRAAAIGAGLIQDLSSVPLLINQLNDLFPACTAACYALGKISSPRSLEAIADGLLHGNELLRRAAAESLAQNRSEGHPALREGALMDDLLVRYAVVHGLGLINEPWSLEILDKLRIDEKEWVVRDLAQQTYEIHQTGSPYLPSHHPPAHSAPWLHQFAAQQNNSAPTPETALDLLLEALEKGSDLQKQAALTLLSQESSPDVIPSLAALFNHPNPAIRQQTALTAWYIAPPNYQLPVITDHPSSSSLN